MGDATHPDQNKDSASRPKNLVRVEDSSAFLSSSVHTG